jgi:hypothetical protein
MIGSPSSSTQATARHIGGAGMPPMPRATEPMPVSPLPAALRHASQRWLPAVLGSGAAYNVAGSALPPPTPTTAMLLRWWFAPQRMRMRADNFDAVQREAIVHTILAHEVLRSADAQALFRAACGVATPARTADDDRDNNRGTYTLRLLPHSGVRWVMQALLLWQWANHAAAAPPDPRFSAHPRLLTHDAATCARLRDALLGPCIAGAAPPAEPAIDEPADDDTQCRGDRGRARDDARDLGRSSLLRHAELFLPPGLRADCLRWLHAAADAPAALVNSDDAAPGLCLHLGDGAQVQWQPARLAGGAGRSAPQLPVLVDAGLAAAVTHGAAKPLLLPALPGPRRLPRRSSSARPVLPRALQAALARALDIFMQLRDGLAPLQPTHPPQGWVLCETPALARAAACWLRRRTQAEGLRIALLTAPPPCGAQPGVAVVALLRTRPGPLPEAWLTAALVPQWRDPACAALRAEDRERIAQGRTPRSLLDVLWLVDAADGLPRDAGPRPLPTSGFDLAADAAQSALAAGVALRWPPHVPLPPAAGPLMRVRPRDEAGLAIAAPRWPGADHDRLTPPMSSPVPVAADAAGSSRAPGGGLPAAAAWSPDRASCRLPSRLLDRRHAAPTRRCAYPWQGWPADSRGLHRGLIDAAEADPAVEAYLLLDGAMPALPGLDALLARCAGPAPDALVRTARSVYVIALEETRGQSDPAPQTPDRAPPPPPRPAGALAAWCAQVAALPASDRGDRMWRPILLPAPMFWRWKRRGTPLSVLLAALADGAALAAALAAPESSPGA